MNNHFTRRVWPARMALAALLSTAGLQAQALIIEFTAAQLGQSNAWRYDYSFENDSASSIEIIDLFFDPVLYENLRDGVAPVDWETVIFPPNPQLGPDLSAQGTFEVAAALDANFLPLTALLPGAMLDGFSVTFDFLGAGTPGAQPFRVFDPLTFDILDEGLTRLAALPMPVWEPGAADLVLMGLALLIGLRTHRRTRLGR